MNDPRALSMIEDGGSMPKSLERLRSDREDVLRQLVDFSKREVLPALEKWQESEIATRIRSLLNRLREINEEMDRIAFRKFKPEE